VIGCNAQLAAEEKCPVKEFSGGKCLGEKLPGVLWGIFQFSGEKNLSGANCPGETV